MSVAIIIVNYNGLADTLDCIKSVKKDSMSATIFVVDNGSRLDESVAIKEHFPEVRTIRSDVNLGFAGGNNVAIKEALKENFDYIMLLNNDTVIDERMIENLFEIANDHTVALPNMYYFDYPDTLWFGGGKIHRFCGKVSHLQNVSTVPYEINFATGCCFLAHRSIFEKVGLLSENYFMYCEDVDFSIRLIRAGITIKMVPNAKLWHKVAKSSPKNGSAFRIYYNTRNRLLLTKTFSDFFSVWTNLYIRIVSKIKMYLAKRKKEISIYDAYKKAMFDFKSGNFGKGI